MCKFNYFHNFDKLKFYLLRINNRINSGYSRYTINLIQNLLSPLFWQNK
jgi:hypothetical protein